MGNWIRKHFRGQQDKALTEKPRAQAHKHKLKMKSNTTPEQIQSIIDALKLMHVYPFREEQSDPKYNAQRNLSGKTHYVDDDTLRWHKSRVLSARHLHGGLLFRIVCSDALDMHNTKRGFRAVVFDVFGTTVYRPSLENASSSKQAALNASEREEIDLVAHYREAIARELKQRQDQAQDLQSALLALPSAA